MKTKPFPRSTLIISALFLAILSCGLPGTTPQTLVTAPQLPTPWPSSSPPPPTITPDMQTDPTSESATLPPELLAEMEALEAQAINLRGLTPTGPVERTILPPEGVRQRILDDFFADYSPEEAVVDARILSLFGLIEPDFDLWSLYIDLYTEQVAGYYDPEAKQLVVVSSADFGGTERLTYIHEYVHVLQDQVYDLEDGLEYNDESCHQDTERCAAIQALIEGDASLVSEQWLRTYATSQDLADIIADAAALQSPVFMSAPDYMQEDFYFPYIQGLAFVRQTNLRGGWAAVDAAYADLPLATEQILHPEVYPNDQPVKLVVPESVAAQLGQDWEEIDRGVLGEWFFRLMLNQQLPNDVASDAADGWGGDYYLALYNQELNAGALVLVIVWDRGRDTTAAFEALRDYGDASFGEPSGRQASPWWETEQAYALLETASLQTLWIFAPDAQTAQTLRQSIPFPASIND